MSRVTVLQRIERIAIVATPVVALAIVGVGLRIGGRGTLGPIRGARIYGRGPGHGRAGLALQLEVLAEDAGVRGMFPGVAVDVEASLRGEHALWHGSTNADGVAEVWLGLSNVRWGDPVRVRAIRPEGESLADGVLEWPAQSSPTEPANAEVWATRRKGALQIEVFVRGGKLVPGSPESVFVRVVEGATSTGVYGVTLTFTPEMGLSVDTLTGRTSVDGWCEVHATAEFLIAGWTVEATSPAASNTPERTGSWYGALPVAPGAASVDLPETIPVERAYPLEFAVPPASPRLYVEVDDIWGRDFGAVLDVAPSSAGGLTKAILPPLAPGEYWLVTSAVPHGTELLLAGSSLARPFRVDDRRAPLPSRPSVSLGTLLFPRAVGLDGLVQPHINAENQRHHGLRLALVALLVASILEVMFVLRAASHSRGGISRQVEASDGTEQEELEAKLEPRGIMGVVILATITLLGFALIAGLLLLRGTS